MTTILSFIVVLGVVLFVHEFGHFAVAKLARVRVLEFGMGFPPRLLSFKRGDTVYSLNLFPLGAFVKMVGEEDPTDPDSLARRPAWVRLAIMAAGPAMNALLPVVLLTIFFMVPRDIPITDVVVTGVEPNSPAAGAGLQPGDVILEVDGRTIENPFDLQRAVQLRLGARSEWEVRRVETVFTTHMVPRLDPPEGQGAVGISSFVGARATVTRVVTGSSASAAGLRSGDLLLVVGSRRVLDAEDAAEAVEAARADDPTAAVPIAVLRDGLFTELELSPELPALTGMELFVRPDDRRSRPIWRAVPQSFTQMREIVVVSKNEISKLISGGTDAFPVTGPIGIAHLTGEVAREDLVALLFLTALISMSLAVLNILPIPALDGGRIAFVLLELARGGRRISPEREGFIHMVGFALLIGLIVVASFNDIQRIISGDSFITR